MASSRDIGGKSCSPNGMQWANDGYEVANLTVKGASGDKPTSWYFLTVNYTAGHSIEHDAQKVIEAGGGKFWAPPAFRSTHPTSTRSCCRRRIPAPRTSVSLAVAPT